LTWSGLASLGSVSRPHRIQFAGAQYHVTSSGNIGRRLFRDDRDRTEFLDLLGTVVAGHGWLCRGYCLLSTHYHLLIETPEPNLASGLQYVNGRYGQWSNRRREECGHLFQARYHSALVQTEGHRYEVHRYISLNPVRAGLVRQPEDWAWSSYGALLGVAPQPFFLDVTGALLDFASSPKKARDRLRTFIADGLTSGR
jgi:putative transposase